MKNASIPTAAPVDLKGVSSIIDDNLAEINALAARKGVRTSPLLVIGVSEQIFNELVADGRLKDHSILIQNLQKYALWHRHVLKGSSAAPSVGELDVYQLLFMGGVETPYEGYCFTEEDDRENERFYLRYNNSRIKNLLILAAFTGNESYYSH